MYFLLESLAIIVVVLLLASILFLTVCAALIFHESAKFIANASRTALTRLATKSANLSVQDGAWILDVGVKDLPH